MSMKPLGCLVGLIVGVSLWLVMAWVALACYGSIAPALGWPTLTFGQVCAGLALLSLTASLMRGRSSP